MLASDSEDDVNIVSFVKKRRKTLQCTGAADDDEDYSNSEYSSDEYSESDEY